MSLKELIEELEKLPKDETIQVSYYIIDYCIKKKYSITNLKLNKLLYFSNIEYMLNNNGKPLFKEEFEAWRHGPVLKSVYETFCMGIGKATEEKLNLIIDNLKDNKINSINKVLDEKAGLDAFKLVELTHIKNGPWELIYNTNKDKNGICTANIPNKKIYDFYKENRNAIQDNKC